MSLSKALVGAVLVLGTGVAPAALTQAPGGLPGAIQNERAMLIVSTHTDDEATALPLYTGPSYAGIRKYFLWIDETEGGSNTQLVNGLPERWNPGEYKPAGNLTSDQSRSDGKYRGSLNNITYLGRFADPNLPQMNYGGQTLSFMRGDRKVTTWMDGIKGGAIRYNIPVRQVTPLSVRNAVNDVTLNPEKFGIPAGVKWTDIISANYYNHSGLGGDSCDLYSNPQHKKVHDGIAKYAFKQFSGWKHFTACKGDSKRIRAKSLTAQVKKYTHAHKGSLNIYFGWLYRGFGVPLMDKKAGVFSSTVWYTVGVARNGV